MNPQSVPRVIAHRGASGDRPENTRAAFDEAIRLGADGMELDVQLSRDGTPFVYHDRSLKKVGGGLRRLSRLDAAELRGLDAGSWYSPTYRNERIPTLSEALERYGRRVTILIEIKARRTGDPRHRELTDAVLQTIDAVQPEQPVFLLCFDRQVLAYAATRRPKLARIWNLKPPARPWRNLGARLENVDAVSADIRTLTPEFAQAVHDTGRPLFSYTSNRPDQLHTNLLCRVDGIMSDRPGWLRNEIDKANSDAR